MRRASGYDIYPLHLRRCVINVVSPDVVFDALGSVLPGAPSAEILANVARIIEKHSKGMLCSISLLISRLTHLDTLMRRLGSV